MPSGTQEIPCPFCGASGKIIREYLDSTSVDELQTDINKVLKRLKKIMDHLGLND